MPHHHAGDELGRYREFLEHERLHTMEGAEIRPRLLANYV
jgi:hypothetical protein